MPPQPLLHVRPQILRFLPRDGGVQGIGTHNDDRPAFEQSRARPKKRRICFKFTRLFRRQSSRPETVGAFLPVEFLQQAAHKLPAFGTGRAAQIASEFPIGPEYRRCPGLLQTLPPNARPFFRRRRLDRHFTRPFGKKRGGRRVGRAGRLL